MCISLHDNNYSYSHRILMWTSLVKGFPTPLSAVHLYLSLFFPFKTFKGIVTRVLSETLLQVIVGFGFPSAEQFKVNSAGANMVWLLEEMILLGGPTKSNWNLHLTEKTCCGFHIFARSTLRMQCPPQQVWVDFLLRCSILVLTSILI